MIDEPKLTIIAAPYGNPDTNDVLANTLEKLKIPTEATTTLYGHNLSLAQIYATLWEIEDSGEDPSCLIITDFNFSDRGFRDIIRAAADPIAPFLMWNERTTASLNRFSKKHIPGSFEYSHHIVLVTTRDINNLAKGKSNLAVEVRSLIDRAHFINLFNEEVDISTLYKNVFSSNEGMIILNDLERIVNQTKIDAQNIDPNTAVWKCAQEALINRIKNQLI